MLDKESHEKIFKQFMEIWILPEIDRRKEYGTLPVNFILSKSQVLFSLDISKPIIRLNDEVKMLAKVKLRKSVKKGQPVYESAIDEVIELRLDDKEKSKYAHVSTVRIRDNWFLYFDFRYNKGMARKHLGFAKQFYESAYLAYQNQLLAPFIDNLFSAVELSVKGELLLMPDEKIYKKTSHKAIQIKYSQFVNIGNAKANFKTALNKLSGLRNSARYLKSNFHLPNKEARRFLNIAKEMIDNLELKLKKEKE